MLTLKNESDDVTIECYSDDQGIAFKHAQVTGGQVGCTNEVLPINEARARFLALAAREFDALFA